MVEKSTQNWSVRLKDMSTSWTDIVCRISASSVNLNSVINEFGIIGLRLLIILYHTLLLRLLLFRLCPHFFNPSLAHCSFLFLMEQGGLEFLLIIVNKRLKVIKYSLPLLQLNQATSCTCIRLRRTLSIPCMSLTMHSRYRRNKASDDIDMPRGSMLRLKFQAYGVHNLD